MKVSESMKITLFFLIMIIISLVLHFEIFGKQLQGIHLWRQAQTQNNITNFFRQDFNILNPRDMSFNGGRDNIMRYEFPIMQWSIAAMYKVFGESIIVTRICMFLIGLWASLGIFFLINHLTKRLEVGLLTSWAFTFSPIFYYYTMNPLPDVLALTASIWFLYYFSRFIEQQKFKDYILSSIFLTLATLAKLPYLMFGGYVAGYVLYLIIHYRNNLGEIQFSKQIKYFILPVILSPAILWYKIVIPTWGTNGVLKGVFDNKITSDKFWEIFKFHLMELLPNQLLGKVNFILFLIGWCFIFKKNLFKKKIFIPHLILALTISSYFFLEINMIEKVHDYYMMPFLIPIFIIVSLGIMYVSKSKLRNFLYLLLLVLPFATYALKQKDWSTQTSYFDPAIINNTRELRALVPKNDKVIMVNDISSHIFPYLVDKQGYIFRDDYLPIEWIKDMINNYNVRYMYSNSQIINRDKALEPLVDTILFNKDGLILFKFKSAN